MTLRELRALLANGEPHPLPDRAALRAAFLLALRHEAVVFGPLPDGEPWAVAASSPWRWSHEAGCWYRRVCPASAGTVCPALARHAVPAVFCVPLVCQLSRNRQNSAHWARKQGVA